MTYSEALSNLTKLILSYPEVRKVGTVGELQELRDQISENLYHFGDTYAIIRSESERAGSVYKMCIEEKKLYWRKKFGSDRGSAGKADSEAMLDCREALDLMHQRNEDFYRAKVLIEGSEQILNSLSSRLKLNSRYE